MTVAVQRSLNLDQILKGDINHDIEADPLVVWDKGVFLNELQRQGIVLSTDSNGAITGKLATDRGLKQGTYQGTQTALTEFYSLIEEAAVSHFDSRGFEPIIPTQRSLEQKRDIYDWSDPSEGPPHLKTLPDDQQNGAPGVGQIFDLKTLGFVQAIASVVQFLIPDNISKEGTPFKGPTIADCEQYNREHPSPKTDIMDGRNLGDKDDWFSDARFAQQHLSGVNPCTITAASSDQIKAYINEATKQGIDAIKQILTEGKDILVQDYSAFRKATGVSDDTNFQNTVPELNGTTPTGKFAFRYACAPVAIFQLHSDGRLHPLAITIDYKGSLDKSVTIFNKRATPDDKGQGVAEKDDWPWRYAKTCVQTADWAMHQIKVHLTDTHMTEEAIIVATNRTIPEDHILYEILSPHWFRTLALNSAARAVLIPYVIVRLSGFGPSIDPKTNRTSGLINWAYNSFDFQAQYIPNDLKRRGFDLEGEKGDKYRNYPYATNMWYLWKVMRNFVATVLGTQYKTDQDVKNDIFIPGWCKEIQIKGQIPTFPTITTVDQLIDAVTMCIHIASPQHTAVNYLQDYYYNFVPSKPPALCTPLPADLKTLQGYKESDLTDALPIGDGPAKWKDWLLAAQLPELLSFKVDNRYNLLTYAKSLYNVNKDRTAFENKKFDSQAIKEAAARFYSQLKDLELAFEFISAMQTEGSVEYKVLQPATTAVSILI